MWGIRQCCAVFAVMTYLYTLLCRLEVTIGLLSLWWRVHGVGQEGKLGAGEN